MIIAAQNRQLLSQISSLIEGLDIRDFISPKPYINQSTVGQHLRHIIEFYQCIVQQCKSKKICYDDRKRNRKLESSIECALIAIQDIQDELAKIHEDFPISISVDYGSLADEKDFFHSSLKRELAYAMDHTIHHLAIIKIMLNLDGVYVPEDLGVAPSTIRFINKNAVLSE